jgi:hypothetical protein
VFPEDLVAVQRNRRRTLAQRPQPAGLVPAGSILNNRISLPSPSKLPTCQAR